MYEQQAREERALIERIEASDVQEYAELLAHAAGWEERVLRLYLGDEVFRRQQARSLRHRRGAAGRPAEPLGNVVLIPGLMGSELATVTPAGKRRPVWIDPLQIALGGMAKLRLAPNGLDAADGEHEVRATGISKLVYGDLLLSLSERWNVRAFWYDWRKDLKISASQLASALDEWFPDDEPVHLVAHSMGGLVARTFVALHPHRWQRHRDARLVMLGTPNHGSFLVPQALSGVAQLLRLLAAVDLQHGLPELTRIVGTFVGLVQMLPATSVFEAASPLYESSTYSPELEVSQHHLDMAARHQELIRDAVDEQRMVNVAGAGRITPDGVSMERLPLRPTEGLERYSFSIDGDGTVPHRSVQLHRRGGGPVRTYYLDEAHATLPRNDLLLDRMDALLRDDIESVPLPVAPPASTAAPLSALLPLAVRQREQSVRQLRSISPRLHARGSDDTAPPVGRTTREVMMELVHHDTGVPREGRKTAVEIPIDPAKITLFVVPGDIVALDGIASLAGTGEPRVDAIAFSHYAGGDPGRVLRTLDRALSEALARKNPEWPASKAAPTSDLLLTQFIERGVIRGSLGQLFFLDDPRSEGAPARTLAIAGMGFKPRFGAPEAALVARELCWALGRLGKKHLATHLLGSGTGNLSVKDAVTAWIRGVKHAVTGEARALERITIIEQDPARVDEIAREIERQREELEWTRNKRMLLDLERLPNDSYTISIPVAEGPDEEAEPREEPRNATRISVTVSGQRYRFGAVTTGASIPERDLPCDLKLIERANEELMREDDADEQVERGRFLTKLLFPQELGVAIFSGSTLVLQLDAATARLHWELAAEPEPTLGGLSGEFLGITRGLTRQLRTWFAPPLDPPPPPKRLLRVMVIADPAEDAHLPGALEEGMAVADRFELFNQRYGDTKCRVEVHRFFGPHVATRTTVLRELMLRSWDVLHFAGHCAYDRKDPSASGWIFGEGERLTARELSRLDRIPRFVFSNACESGVTPDRAELRSVDLAPSFAESFFQQGVANFVCTGWPVDDVAAKQFALDVYDGLLGLRGAETADPCVMFEAMKRARLRLMEAGPAARGARTWGAYQHYGNPFYRFFDAAALRDQRAERRSSAAPSPSRPRVSESPAPEAPPATGNPNPLYQDLAPLLETHRSVANLLARSRLPVEPGLAPLPADLAKDPEILRKFETAVAATKKLGHGQQPSLSEEETSALDLFVHLVLRPAPRVNKGRITVPTETWPALDRESAHIARRLRGVGRIDRADRTALGTAWFVAPGHLMTNNHVVAGLCGLLVNKNSAWRQALDARVKECNAEWATYPERRPAWDSGDSPRAASKPICRVLRVRAIHPTLDLALLEVDGPEDSADLVLPVAGTRPSEENGEPIYVPGYPAVNYEIGLHPSLLRLLFGEPDGKVVHKRVAPGLLRGLDGSNLQHDASTLGGNSGSPVLSLQTHAVVGLHFHGSYGKANQAVPLWTLSGDPFFTEPRITFR